MSTSKFHHPNRDRRSLIVGAASALAGSALAPWAAAAEPAPASASASAPTPAGPKTLRYAFEIAETGFDPVKLQDLYSRTVTAHIFEAPYHYDPLARPVKILPLTAIDFPEIEADFTVWTVRLRPGIFFADDPAFEGRPRELVADDFVFTFKRFADPANSSPAWSNIESVGMVGLAEYRGEVLAEKKPFDYRRPIPGLRAIDRHTLRFTLKSPRPRFLETLAQSDIYGALAHEVVAAYPGQVDAHPVGTGPFRLVQWRRSSFIALERNPTYRERLYEAEPAADDVEGQAILARFKGRRLPMIDRVEISIIEEAQPRWLSFVGGQADMIRAIGFEFAAQAMPNGHIAPNLAKRGITGYLIAEPAGNYYIFNMDDPVFGGYAPDRVALRRAIALGMDVQGLINYAYSGLGSVAQSPTLPGTNAFDPTFKSEFGDYDPARANSLLDIYGYHAPPGSPWRHQLDGSPLVLRVSTQSDQRSRKMAEVLERNLRALGIRMETVTAQWPENLKAARAGRLQFWGVGNSAVQPDSIGAFDQYSSAEIGGFNFARIKLPALDALYAKLQRLPDGLERTAAFRQMIELGLAYMPYKSTVNRIAIDMTHPQLIGYRRPVFWQEWWHTVDIDESLRRTP